ncbi:hypothetical protein WOLCODRAFT_17679 [Wolfiporia cocos MD-104 SS10]|uniref:Uncharacterized protein n=1 Tax=Wolfiporia cocos (strain MD-104) TaxID=742152 RepID=A0A2H3JTZ8_WOLCO|nr:hypothetical protein WOLCODRAFT_17679 [Wolfiporia cocos MD-104 SS10]
MVKPSSFLPKGARQPASGDKPSKLPACRIPRRVGLSTPVKGGAIAQPRPRCTRAGFEDILYKHWDVKGDLNREHIMVCQVEDQHDSSDMYGDGKSDDEQNDKACATSKTILSRRQRSNSDSSTESSELQAQTPCSVEDAIWADSAAIKSVDALVGRVATTKAEEIVDTRKEHGPVRQLAQWMQTPGTDGHVIQSERTDAHTRLLDSVLAEVALSQDVDTKAKAYSRLLDDLVADIEVALKIGTGHLKTKAHADLLETVIVEIEVTQYAASTLDVINAIVVEPFSEGVDVSKTTDVHWHLNVAQDENLLKYAVTDEHSSGPMADRWALDTEGDEYLNQNRRPLVRRVEDDKDPWATRWILDTRGDELLSGRNVRTDEQVSNECWASRWTLDTAGDEHVGRRPIVRAVECEEDRWATRWFLPRTEDDEVIPKDVAKLRSMAIRNCVRLGVPICFYAF